MRDTVRSVCETKLVIERGRTARLKKNEGILLLQYLLWVTVNWALQPWLCVPMWCGPALLVKSS